MLAGNYQYLSYACREIPHVPCSPALLKIGCWMYDSLTAVEDLSVGKADDPAANPALRADKAWGPFTGSKECKW
jgi:hypothetical protein